MIVAELTAKDMAKAEIIWVKELQKELMKHKGFPTWKRQFNLFLEEEVWRCGKQPPFMYTGVDFARPLHVKAQSLVSTRKVWICLYTCCVTSQSSSSGDCS